MTSAEATQQTIPPTGLERVTHAAASTLLHTTGNPEKHLAVFHRDGYAITRYGGERERTVVDAYVWAGNGPSVAQVSLALLRENVAGLAFVSGEVGKVLMDVPGAKFSEDLSQYAWGQKQYTVEQARGPGEIAPW